MHPSTCLEWKDVHLHTFVHEADTRGSINIVPFQMKLLTDGGQRLHGLCHQIQLFAPRVLKTSHAEENIKLCLCAIAADNNQRTTFNGDSGERVRW